MLKLLLAVVLLFTCGTKNDAALIETPPLEDVLTLELIFGDKDLPDEYLLAYGDWYPGANDSGDVFVPDESRIKVYDKNGNHKMIIGGPGQGPGEFPGQLTGVSISPTGYLTADENVGYTLFSPEYNFIKNVRSINVEKYRKIRKEKGWQNYSMYDMVSFDENMIVYLLNVDNYHYPLIFENADSIHFLSELPSTKKVKVENRYINITFRSEILWVVPNDKNIVYIHPDYHSVRDDAGSYFTLNFFDIYDYSIKQYQYGYTPILVPDSVRTKAKRRYAGERYDGIRGKIYNIIDDIEYLPSLKKLYSDRNVIFAVTNRQNEKGEFLTCIINSETGSLMHNIYLPFLPHELRGGNAYMLSRSKEGFPVIEKYRIDPAVYGKY